MSALTWRTIERGKRWREKAGRFVIELRVGGDYGPTPRYLLLAPTWGAQSLSAQQPWVAQSCGLHNSLAEAKAAAEARA